MLENTFFLCSCRWTQVGSVIEMMLGQQHISYSLQSCPFISPCLSLHFHDLLLSGSYFMLQQWSACHSLHLLPYFTLPWLCSVSCQTPMWANNYLEHLERFKRSTKRFSGSKILLSFIMNIYIHKVESTMNPHMLIVQIQHIKILPHMLHLSSFLLYCFKASSIPMFCHPYIL